MIELSQLINNLTIYIYFYLKIKYIPMTLKTAKIPSNHCKNSFLFNGDLLS